MFCVCLKGKRKASEYCDVFREKASMIRLLSSHHTFGEGQDGQNSGKERKKNIACNSQDCMKARLKKGSIENTRKYGILQVVHLQKRALVR